MGEGAGCGLFLSGLATGMAQTAIPLCLGEPGQKHQRRVSVKALGKSRDVAPLSGSPSKSVKPPIPLPLLTCAEMPGHAFYSQPSEQALLASAPMIQIT